MDAIHEAALDWFTRLHGGSASEIDRIAFSQWYAADPAHAAAFEHVSRFWESDDFSQAAQAMTFSLPAAKVRRPWIRQVTALAAAVLLVWASAFALDLPVRWQADYRAPIGQHRSVTLDDGSTVILNSGAAIATDLSGVERKVRLLAGEAYFDVAHDPARPFLVDAGVLNVRVLGTRFSVRADSGQEMVAVRSGLVQVSEGQNEPIRLWPGQALRLEDRHLASPQMVGDGAWAWLDNALVFHDKPFAQVLAELDRYHPGMIVLANPELGQVRISGHYRLDTPAATVDSLAKVVSGSVIHLTDSVLIVR